MDNSPSKPSDLIGVAAQTSAVTNFSSLDSAATLSAESQMPDFAKLIPTLTPEQENDIVESLSFIELFLKIIDDGSANLVNAQSTAQSLNSNEISVSGAFHVENSDDINEPVSGAQ